MRRSIATHIFTGYLALIFCLFTAGNVAAQKQTNATLNPSFIETIITPADVYVEFARIYQTINKIGIYMGVPPPEPLGINVAKVTPVDIYFQAQNLYKAINRLSFEVLRQQTRESATIPDDSIKPAHIMKLAGRSFRILDSVANKFDIPVPIPQSLTESVGLKDIFSQIVEGKRYLNILLLRRYAPSDVYQLVNLSIGYAARFLAFHKAPDLIPPTPEFIAGKRPNEVYFLLYECLETLSEIYMKTDLDMVKINISGIDKAAITPGDVFDLAALIVARLHFYNQMTGVTKLPRMVYSPGLKYPSHVYVQCGILLDQLHLILSTVSKR